MNEWQPIETAPKMRTILLWALTDTETGNWKMETGFWHTGYDNWTWEGRQIKSYDHQPTHWQPLPDPPTELPGGKQKENDTDTSSIAAEGNGA